MLFKVLPGANEEPLFKMFHFESITAKLNETNEKAKKVQDVPTLFSFWHDYQTNSTHLVLDVSAELMI